MSTFSLRQKYFAQIQIRTPVKLYPHRAAAAAAASVAAAVARSIEMHYDIPKWILDPFQNSDAYLDADA